MKIIEMESAPLTSLRQIATDLNIPNAKRLKKENLIIQIRRAEAAAEGIEVRGGVLEITPEGVGFLRNNYSIGPDDVYVSQAQLRRYELRMGDFVIGVVRPPRDAERHYGLLKVETVNAVSPEEIHVRKTFESLTPIFPDKRFNLETDRTVLSSRLIDLIAPIGRGQRGMIVSPPKAGKTTILKQLANSISANNPEIHLIIALIGERPEEVTDMDRSVDDGVVVYSNWNVNGYGNLIVVDHGNGWQSVYAHLDSFLKYCGDNVSQGEQIATLGNTGNSTGAHLHFELRSKDYGAVNPHDFLILP